MDTEIKNLLLKHLDEALVATQNSLAKAVEFLQQEIPDVLAQLLRWEFAWSLIWWSVGLILITLVLIGWKKYVCYMKKHADDCVEGNCIVFGVALFFATLISVVTFFSNFTWLKIWLAPKVFLIEYLSKFVK